MAVAASVVERQVRACPVLVHGGSVPVHVVAAPVRAHADALVLLEHAVRRHFRPVKLDGVVPTAGKAVHVPHVGAQLAADAVAVARVAQARCRVGLRIGQVVLFHDVVVFEAATRHDHALRRLDVHALRPVLVHAAQNLLRFRILHQRRQGSFGQARNGVGMVRQGRVQELDHMGHAVRVFLVEVDGGRRVGMGQFAPFGGFAGIVDQLLVGGAQPVQPFPMVDHLVRKRLQYRIRRSCEAATEFLQVFEQPAAVVAREDDARREYAVAVP